MIPAQVLGELVNAVGRRRPERVALAEELVGLWSLLYDTAATTADHIVAATSASVLVTEDMQDGAVVGGSTLLDPFAPSHRDRLEEVMTAS